MFQEAHKREIGEVADFLDVGEEHRQAQEEDDDFGAFY